MPNPEQGRIILAEVSDVAKRNRKLRPVVIVTPTDEIRSGEVFYGVAITGTIPKKIPPDCVLLPYHPRGHPRTGLKKRCAAMCSWLVEIGEEHIQRYLGVVPGQKLQEILDRLQDIE